MKESETHHFITPVHCRSQGGIAGLVIGPDTSGPDALAPPMAAS
jgi:hypothetical protein